MIFKELNIEREREREIKLILLISVRPILLNPEYMHIHFIKNSTPRALDERGGKRSNLRESSRDCYLRINNPLKCLIKKKEKKITVRRCRYVLLFLRVNEKSGH